MIKYFKRKRVQTKTDGNLSIPIDFTAITLGQYIRWNTSKNSVDKCAAALNCSEQQVRKLNPESIQRIVTAFDQLIQNETQLHLKFVDLNGTRYGFIPDMDMMSADEWIDLDEFCKMVYDPVKPQVEKLTCIMAVLYRPIKTKLGNRYTIATYTGEEQYANADDINQLSMSVVNAALLFFSTFELALLENFLESMMELQQEKEMILKHLQQ
jgi:hypothetical protein